MSLEQALYLLLYSRQSRQAFLSGNTAGLGLS